MFLDFGGERKDSSIFNPGGTLIYPEGDRNRRPLRPHLLQKKRNQLDSSLYRMETHDAPENGGKKKNVLLLWKLF